MFIPVYLLITIIIVALLIPGYRPAIINIFTALWHLICGTISRLWNFIRGNAPAAGTAVNTLGRRILAILLLIALIGIIIVLAGYILLGVVFLIVGAITGNTLLVLGVLGLLFLYGFIGLFPGNFFFRGIRSIIRGVVVLMLLYFSATILWQMFGGISPEVQKSTGRAISNRATETANWLDKYSLKSEGEAGIFARVSEDCRVYGDGGAPFTSLKANDLVYVLSTEGKAKTIDGEGMTWVMLPNQDGEFIGGKRGWIPSRKIDWKSNISPAKEVRPAVIEKAVREVHIKQSQVPWSMEVLTEGRYEVRFQPEGAINGARVAILLPDGKSVIRNANGIIFVGKGEQAYGVWSKTPSIARIYAR